MDVKMGLLHGDLKEEVFLMQPPRYELEDFPKHVYSLDNVVNGLKYAPKARYNTFLSLFF